MDVVTSFQEAKLLMQKRWQVGEDEKWRLDYKRTHKESYMIISTEEYVSDYEEQMLKENEIRSLLSFYTMEMNGQNTILV